MFNCYVRIYAPLDANGKPVPSGFGHFDLQINSQGNNTMNFDSNTILMNPVLSYGGANGVGYVKMFNEANTSQVFTNDYLLCKYHFTAEDSKVFSLLSALRGMLTYQSKDANCNACSVYRVTSSEFASYSDNRTNSFRAVAVWCSALGMNLLETIYNSSAAQANHMTYSAWTLFDQLYTNWQFHELSR